MINHVYIPLQKYYILYLCHHFVLLDKWIFTFLQFRINPNFWPTPATLSMIWFLKISLPSTQPLSLKTFLKHIFSFLRAFVLATPSGWDTVLLTGCLSFMSRIKCHFFRFPPSPHIKQGPPPIHLTVSFCIFFFTELIIIHDNVYFRFPPYLHIRI